MTASWRPDPLGTVRRAGFPLRAPSTPRSVEPPPPRHPVGRDYDTDWAREPMARATRRALNELIVRPGIAVLARPDRQGLDRLDDLDGPVIFVANHHSHIDTPLLITSIPDRWRHDTVVAAAADYFFPNRLRSAWSAWSLGAIPMERTKVGRTSADLAARLIDEGHSLLIFPEGGRSKDGWGQPFRGGAAYLALRCGVPVVPVFLEGTGRILRKGRALPRPSRTSVTFGDPLFPSEGGRSRELAERIEAAVRSLGDEVATDWYQARLRAHRGDSPSLGGPSGASWRRAWALGNRSPGGRRSRRRWPDLT